MVPLTCGTCLAVLVDGTPRCRLLGLAHHRIKVNTQTSACLPTSSYFGSTLADSRGAPSWRSRHLRFRSRLTREGFDHGLAHWRRSSNGRTRLTDLPFQQPHSMPLSDVLRATHPYAFASESWFEIDLPAAAVAKVQRLPMAPSYILTTQYLGVKVGKQCLKTSERCVQSATLAKAMCCDVG